MAINISIELGAKVIKLRFVYENVIYITLLKMEVVLGDYG
jgi:hypothetical protein